MNFGVRDFSRLAVADWRFRRWRLWQLPASTFVDIANRNCCDNVSCWSNNMNFYHGFKSCRHNKWYCHHNSVEPTASLSSALRRKNWLEILNFFLRVFVYLPPEYSAARIVTSGQQTRWNWRCLLKTNTWLDFPALRRFLATKRPITYF